MLLPRYSSPGKSHIHYRNSFYLVAYSHRMNNLCFPVVEQRYLSLGILQKYAFDRTHSQGSDTQVVGAEAGSENNYSHSLTHGHGMSDDLDIWREDSRLTGDTGVSSCSRIVGGEDVFRSCRYIFTEISREEEKVLFHQIVNFIQFDGSILHNMKLGIV